MQRLLSEDPDKKGLVASGLGMVANNRRFIFWFWLLNLTLAEFGTSAFRTQAHTILDHSFYSGRLVSGFDLSVVIEMFMRPEFGSINAVTMPALFFAFMFFAATALFLPGVLLGYSSNYHLPRDDFFRACGENLWRFVRLLIVAGIVMGIAAGALFALQAVLVKQAMDSANELLPFTVRMTMLAIIFLAMTTLRIAFDLAEADVVLSRQNAVRKSIAAGFRHTLRNLLRLVASYVLITMVAAIIMLTGLWIWLRFVPPPSLIGAFAIGQVILLLLLVPRFWQRGVAVAYCHRQMLAPVTVNEPILPEPISQPAINPPAASAAMPEAPSPQQS